MDNQYTNNDEVKKAKAASTLALASMIFGIISIFSTFCCLPFVFSGLGIAFALLSKRSDSEMLPPAKTGMITSTIGVIASLIISISIVLISLSTLASENLTKDEWNQYYDNYEEQYGMEMPADSYEIYQDIKKYFGSPSEL